MKTRILLSEIVQLHKVTALYILYRRAINANDTDSTLIEKYLYDRMAKKQALMLEARVNDVIVGFAHLYPSFSSVKMRKIYIMRDIFITQKFCNSEIGSMLIRRAEEIVSAIGINKLLVRTSDDHIKNILESSEYKIDHFIYYSKLLKKINSDRESMNIEIRKVTNISSKIYNLFDKYRLFYKQSSNQLACNEYLIQRLNNNESIIFEAKYNGVTVGFIQLYPGFSSSTLSPYYILNDLFVEETYRNLGVGSQLISYVESFLKANGVEYISLQTALDNPARALYKKLGYEEDKLASYFYKELDVELFKTKLRATELPDFANLKSITITS